MIQNKLSDEVYKKRFKPKVEDIRGPYFRDQCSIIHSFPFRKLKRKAQVFYAPDNDNICTRIEHVLHVFTNSTTICKGLIKRGWKLDINMCQAIALGHDVGHAPFGHVGEETLKHIVKSQTKGRDSFHHEINSLRFMDYIANKGNGLKLTFGVRDGIVSHCGEKLEQFMEPDWEIIKLEEINNLGKYPSSYEGCIVRIADKISYLGRDLEDAMGLKILSTGSISEEILKYLNIEPSEVKNQFNKKFLDVIIHDIIKTSNKTRKIGISTHSYKIIKMIDELSMNEIYQSKILMDYQYYIDKILHNIWDTLSDFFDVNGFNKDFYNNHFIKSIRDGFIT